MKQRPCLIIVFIILASLLSCRNDLIPLEEMILDRANDRTAPVVLVESPSADSVYGQNVAVTGLVSDDGSVLPVLTYQVQDDLGKVITEGTAELSSVESTTGVSASFDIRFSTESMCSDILIILTATDWNGNVDDHSSFRLQYPGNSIPSLKAVSGNNAISLSWEPLSEAREYIVYYTLDEESFTEASASQVRVVPEAGQERISLVLNKDEHGVRNNRLSQVLVRAVTSEGNLDSSVMNIVPLGAESLTPRLSAGADAVFLDWNPVHCAEGYDAEYTVWRSKSGEEGSFSRISPVGWTYSHFRDESVSEGNIFYYKVSCESFSSVISTAAVCKSLKTIPGAFIADYTEILGDESNRSVSTYTFTPDGNRLFIFDKYPSNRTIMELDINSCSQVGTTYSVGNLVYDMAANNDTLFILKAGSSLNEKVIISLDISTPGTITEQDRITVDYTKSICLKDQTLYLTKSNSSNHFAMDVSNPSDLKTESALSYGGSISVTSGSTSDLFFVGDTLYSRCRNGSGTSQIALYDSLSDSWSAVNLLDDAPGFDQSDLLYTYMTANGDSGKLAVLCDTHYLSNSDVLLWIYDIGSDGSLTLMEFKVLDDRNTSYQNMPVIIDNTLFVKRSNNTVQAININGRIYEKKSHSIPHYPRLLSPDGNSLFVTTYDNGIGMVSLNTGAPLSLRATWAPPAPACGALALDRGRLYSFGNYKTIRQYSIGNNDTLTLLDSDTASGWGIAVNGDVLYQRTGNRRIDLYSISSSGALGGKIGEIVTQREVYSISFAGDYLIAGEKYKVEIFDVSDSDKMISISDFDTNYNVTGTEVYEDSLLVLDSNYGLCCYNFSNPEDPVLEGVFYDRASSSRTVHAVDVQEGLVYLGTNTGLFVLNLEEASNWRTADSSFDNYGSASCWIEGDAKGVKVAGDFLYFSNSGYLGAYSLSNPKNPELFYEDTEARYINSITLWGNSLFGLTTGTLYSFSQDG
ncbi:MAG: hypothetical protein PQJ58_04425 [Spirochaetales bacterium]|nr:hypothetical protein [Spirochaetales bacterium]